MRLKKLIVKNFKSLHDCEIELGKFNVLIGVNASGKSNFVEVFKLLRKIYVEKDSSPFLEWWGYNNVVWQRKEELPITIGMLFDVEGYDVYFETTFTGTGGRFQILREVLDIKRYVKIEKEGTLLRIIYDPKWLSNSLSKLPPSIENWIWNIIALQEFEKEYILPTEQKEMSMLDLCSSMEGVYSQDHTIAYSICYPQDFRNRELAIPVITPVIESTHKMRSSLYFEIVLGLHQFLAKTKILKQLYLQNIKSPQFSRKETTLNEDASNLVSLLYSIWLRKGGLPEGIGEPLSIVFPNTRIFFQLTEDGRVMMKVFENDFELAPPSISDGFYKVLALLTAVYLKPPLLIIDEIENSLHPETLELILDTIRESDVQAIITTHSPVVVDMTEPADLILVDKEQGETKFKRITEPEKIKKFLQEKGLALSEGWLYGSIFENNERH